MKPAQLSMTIYQGATFRESLERKTVPYPVRYECGRLVREDCGLPVPEEDIQLEDYTDCTARMQMRSSIDSPDVILELTTENGGIELDGANLTLTLTSEQTKAFKYGRTHPAWTSCIGHIEVIRPSGDVERQYEIRFSLSREGTK